MTFPQTILPTKVELDLNGTLTDITAYTYQRDPILISRGRPDEGSTVNPTTCTLTLDNRDGRFSPRNPTGAYYGSFGRNSQIKVSVQESASWLQINQVTDTTVTPTHISTTDKAALDITGDIDLRFEADLDSWRDSMDLVSKWTETGNQRSYAMYLNVSGTLSISHSTDGTATGVLTGTSTIPVPITRGRLAVRATLTVSSGGNRIRNWYFASTLAGPWTLLDTLTSAGTTSIFASTATLHVLDNPNNTLFTSLIRGRVYGANVYNGIAGTLVADPDFTARIEGATSFTDNHSNTWTVNGDADITYYDSRFIGEVSSWPAKADVTGSDIASSITAAGVTRRLVQGSSLGSALSRGVPRDSTVISYWAMEDGENATSLGATVPTGGKPITVSPTCVPASDSGFACSDPIPLVGTTPLKAFVASYTATGETTIQFLLHVPAGGLAGGSIIATINTTGTAARWDLLYGTGSGGTLALRAWDSSGTVLTTLGPTAFLVDDTFKFVAIRLSNSGADVVHRITTYTVGDAVSGTTSATLAAFQVGQVQSVFLNPSSSADYATVAVGHLAVTNSITSAYTQLDQVNAYAGELATTRIKRLATEESVQFCPVGARFAGDSVTLGPQLPGTLLTLLQEAATADGGILCEGRDFFELRYIPAHALYSQRSEVTLDYPSHQMDALDPVEDDQQTHNDVTVSRIGGGNARSEVTTGALSTAAPPSGVGRYDTSVSLSLQDDTTLDDQAGWRSHLGTVDEARYPSLPLSLESGHFSGIAINRLDLGDRLSITSPPTELAAQISITQLVQGYTEELNAYRRGFTFNLSPASPWDVGVYGDPYAEDRYGNGDCTTTEALDTTETGVDVLTGTTGKRWSTTAVPYTVIIGGETMTVTAVSGTTKTQTLTVTRSVNGVVKSHLTGAKVELIPLSYYGV